MSEKHPSTTSTWRTPSEALAASPALPLLILGLGRAALGQVAMKRISSRP